MTIHLRKLAIIFILPVLIPLSCKISYEDISLGNYSDTSGELRGFEQENYGYIIYDIESDQIVKGHNIRTPFTPASVTKLFTSLFAEEILGKDFSFTTSLSYTGDISGSILNGDIYLEGSGDPDLSVDGLQSIIRGLESLKIKEIKGSFYYDETLFNPREMLDKGMPADAFYNPGLSALTFNSNIIYALQKRNSEGSISSSALLPSLQSFGSFIYKENLPYPFFRYNYTGGKELWGLPGKNLWDNRLPLPVKRPGLFTAQTFQELCRIHGIILPSPKNGRTASNSKIIYEYKSEPLADIIKNMLYSSNNLTAELIYTIASATYSKKQNTKSNETEMMKYFFTRSFTGVEWKNFRIANASGLTNLNKATPEQTAAVLLYIEKTAKDKFSLEQILPCSGWDGTMKMRLDQPETAFRVYGKTGSIFYASGLAGLFYAKSGKRYIFTVYINDNSKRSEYDNKKNKSAEDLNRGGLWSRKSASAIDEFVLKMIEEL